jgi:hypothetical protein
MVLDVFLASPLWIEKKKEKNKQTQRILVCVQPRSATECKWILLDTGILLEVLYKMSCVAFDNMENRVFR